MESETPPSRAVPLDLPTRDSVAEWSRTKPVEELERSRKLGGTIGGMPPPSDGLKWKGRSDL